MGCHKYYLGWQTSHSLKRGIGWHSPSQLAMGLCVLGDGEVKIEKHHPKWIDSSIVQATIELFKAS